MSKIYEKTTETYDRLGEKYLEDSLKAVLKERTHFLKSIAKNSKILDVGCGGGRDAQIFTQKGHKVVGIDLSKVLLKEARKRAPQARFAAMDVTKLNFPENSFDAIWAEAVLLHLQRRDIPKALKGLYRVLKPGGLAHITVKKGRGEKVVKEKLSGWQERFYTFYSKKELVELVKKAGFRVVYSSIFGDPFGRKGMKWAVAWGRKA